MIQKELYHITLAFIGEATAAECGVIRICFEIFLSEISPAVFRLRIFCRPGGEDFVYKGGGRRGSSKAGEGAAGKAQGGGREI